MAHRIWIGDLLDPLRRRVDDHRTANAYRGRNQSFNDFLYDTSMLKASNAKRILRGEQTPTPRALEGFAQALQLGDADTLLNKLYDDIGRSPPPLPADGMKDLKTHIPLKHEHISQALLRRGEAAPSFSAILPLLKCEALGVDERDDQVLPGPPPYTHLVQASMVVVLERRHGPQVLMYKRRRDRHRRTLGNSILFSTSLQHNITHVVSPLDGWVEAARISSSDAERRMLVGDGVRPPLVRQLFGRKLNTQTQFELLSLEPLAVVTNDQRGFLGTDGKEMATVYTSFVFVARFDLRQVQSVPLSHFLSVTNVQELSVLTIADQVRHLENALGGEKRPLRNVMDVAIIHALKGLPPSDIRGVSGLARHAGRFSVI